MTTFQYKSGSASSLDLRPQLISEDDASSLDLGFHHESLVSSNVSEAAPAFTAAAGTAKRDHYAAAAAAAAAAALGPIHLVVDDPSGWESPLDLSPIPSQNSGVSAVHSVESRLDLCLIVSSERPGHLPSTSSADSPLDLSPAIAHKNLGAVVSRQLSESPLDLSPADDPDLSEDCASEFLLNEEPFPDAPARNKESAWMNYARPTAIDHLVCWPPTQVCLFSAFFTFFLLTCQNSSPFRVWNWAMLGEMHLTWLPNSDLIPKQALLMRVAFFTGDTIYSSKLIIKPPQS